MEDLTEAKSQAFNAKIANAVTQSYVGLGLFFGLKHGLFPALAKEASCKSKAIPSSQLAHLTKCKERYVREWINGMVCSDIVDHDVIDGEDRYWVEEFRIPALLETSVLSKLYAALASSHLLVSDCFPDDGPAGTRVDDYPGVHEFLASLPGIWGSAEKIQMLIAGDPDLHKIMNSGAHVLEVGCGAANPTKALAQMYLDCSFTATDLSHNVLETAKANCEGLPNVTCHLLDACNIPDDMESKFDVILMVDVFHDVPFPDQLSAGLYKALKPGGIALIIDIAAHESLADNKTMGEGIGSFYLISMLYCLPTSAFNPGSAALGACAGEECITRILLANRFKEVQRMKEVPFPKVS